jgi:Tol biopolymer transport system component/DNA-binding winged helix-turn-helix (wHTH) protein
VALSPKAFETLVALVRRAGRLADKDELLKEVWPDTFVEESNLAQNVFALRKALSEGENGQKYIETVPKRGYRFLASVRIIEDKADELSIEQHIIARNRSAQQIHPPDEALESGLVTAEAAGAQIVILEPAEGAKKAEENSQSLQRPAATDIKGQSRPKTRNAAIIVALLVLTLGAAALLYKLARRANPSLSFQTMKISRLTSTGKATNAVISPDGQYVVYTLNDRGQQSLWLKQVATLSDKEIVAGAEVNYLDLSFSRDGNYIYYVATGKNHSGYALYQMPTLGGTAKRLADGIESRVAISPDEKRFAFVRLYLESGVVVKALVVRNADGSGEKELFRAELPYDFGGSIQQPAWSPDGKILACTIRSTAGGLHYEVLAVRLEDGVVTPIPSPRWSFIGAIEWLNDSGGLVVAATAQDGSGDTSGFIFTQLWQLPFPNGEARRITNDLSGYKSVRLTADSQTLVTVQANPGADLWTVASNGATSEAQQIDSGNGHGGGGVAWTPDGKIVSASRESHQIWSMEANGSNPRQLTTEGGMLPTVTADGRYIVFQSLRSGTPNIWRMDVDGANPKPLTNGPFNIFATTSADSQWVLYSSLGAGRPAIRRVPIDGGTPELLIDRRAVRPVVSPDGQLIACNLYDEASARWKVAIIPFSGGEPVKLLDIPNPSRTRRLRWTPDGRAVAYIETSNGVSNIWSQPIDGGPPLQLTYFKQDLIFEFDLSRDGKQLALSRGTVKSDVVLIKDFR